MSSNNKRILYLDIAKGIAIILMLIFHFMPDHFLKQYAYSFHMPLFIIISGYFYKDEKLTTFIKKTIKTLLIPYFICIIITYIIVSLCSSADNVDCKSFRPSLRPLVGPTSCKYDGATLHPKQATTKTASSAVARHKPAPKTESSLRQRRWILYSLSLQDVLVSFWILLSLDDDRLYSAILFIKNDFYSLDRLVALYRRIPFVRRLLYKYYFLHIIYP